MQAQGGALVVMHAHCYVPVTKTQEGSGRFLLHAELAMHVVGIASNHTRPSTAAASQPLSFLAQPSCTGLTPHPLSYSSLQTPNLQHAWLQGAACQQGGEGEARS